MALFYNLQKNIAALDLCLTIFVSQLEIGPGVAHSV
jgi:hypothetical protein